MRDENITSAEWQMGCRWSMTKKCNSPGCMGGTQEHCCSSLLGSHALCCLNSKSASNNLIESYVCFAFVETCSMFKKFCLTDAKTRVVCYYAKW